MFERLLVPVDGTEAAERAMKASIALAERLQAVIIGFVAEPDLRAAEDGPKASTRLAAGATAAAHSHGHQVLQLFQARADAAQVPFEGVVALTTNIDEAIIKAALKHTCDLIVMVTHGRGAFGERLFGSHTKSVMSQCKLPLLVLH